MADRSRGRGRGQSRGGDGGNRGGGRGRGEFSDQGGSRGRGRGRGESSSPYPGRGGGGRGLFGQGRGESSDRGGSRGRGGRGGGGSSGPAKAFSHGGAPAPAASTVVANLEGQLAAQASKKPASASGLPDLSELSLEARLPRRPAFGSGGQAVLLWANYFELKSDLKTQLYRYSIAVAPEANGKKLEQIVRLLLSEDAVLVKFAQDIASDFRSTIIARRKLPAECVGEFTVVYRSEYEDTPKPNPQTYKVRIQDSEVVYSMQQLLAFTTSTSIDSVYGDRLPMIQALNIVLGDYAKRSKHMITVGTSKTFSTGNDTETYDLGRFLVAMRGFFSSVRLATSRILVNVNVSHGAFYAPVRISDMIRGEDPRRILPFIKGLKVYTTHLKGKSKGGKTVPRIKTISAFARKGDGNADERRPEIPREAADARGVRFWLAPAAGSAGGRYISVADFFKQTHGINLAHPDLPVLNVGTRERPSYLPPEVCEVIPGQSYNRKLSPQQTSNMITFAVRRPWQNAESISNAGPKIAGLVAPPNDKVTHFKLALQPQLITVNGRVLAGPPIQYQGSNNKPSRVNPAFGSWNMRNIKFMKPKPLNRWGVLNIEYARGPGGPAFQNVGFLPAQMGRLSETLRNIGMPAGPPTLKEEVRLRDGQVETAELDAVFKKASEQNMQLLFVVLPDKGTALYAHVKRLGDQKYGVHTTCTAVETLRKNVDFSSNQGRPNEVQTLANLALKFNLKLGGTNQELELSRLQIVREDKTMFVGIDVTHPSPGSTAGTPSVAAVVANIDSSMGQWPAALCVQKKALGEMVLDKLRGMIRTRLDNWIKLGGHKSYPENILIYRDGVSEGQYPLVLDQELPQIRAACAEVYPKPDQAAGLPRITLIIVGKRHHTRFYPTSTSDNNMERSQNCLPGTVVDRGVTEARNWDFYLQAHSALQGTARPAHYQVLLDEIFTGSNSAKKPGPIQRNLEAQNRNKADVVEELTLAMSHVFGRATKVISYATPARYADMVCERARAYLSAYYDPSTPQETPGTSIAGDSSGPAPGLNVADNNIAVHERLRNSMFYV